MYEVYDINTKEAIATFGKKFEALDCAAEMNEGKLDPLYRVRTACPDDYWDDCHYDSDRERWGGNF